MIFANGLRYLRVSLCFIHVKIVIFRATCDVNIELLDLLTLTRAVVFFHRLQYALLLLSLINYLVICQVSGRTGEGDEEERLQRMHMIAK